MRITGYLTEHGVLGLVSTLFTFYRRSSSVFFLFPLLFCILCAFITWLASVCPGLGIFTGSFRSHTPKGLL
jgi:hypothetical protein